MDDILLSLCDHSGAWSAPYIAEGVRVIRVDPKHDGIDHGGRGLLVGSHGEFVLRPMGDGGWGLGLTAGAVADLLAANPLALGGPVRGILMAPPCTDFAGSGARWWPAKDVDGRTAESVSIIEDCLRVRDACPDAWWVLENPTGRLERLVPGVGRHQMTFHPHHYAMLTDHPEREAYTKRTCLWGDFNTALVKAEIAPVMFEKTRKDGTRVRGSWMWANLGGKSERTKELRSVTPVGFALAFHAANPLIRTDRLL